MLESIIDTNAYYSYRFNDDCSIKATPIGCLVHRPHQIMTIANFRHHWQCACAVMLFGILHMQTYVERVYFYIIN